MGFEIRVLMGRDFSVQPLCSLCLCGGFILRNFNHRDTEHTEVAQRRTQLPYVDDHFIARYAPQTQAHQYIPGIRKLVR